MLDIIKYKNTQAEYLLKLLSEKEVQLYIYFMVLQMLTLIILTLIPLHNFTLVFHTLQLNNNYA